jgi:hypothetical protein
LRQPYPPTKTLGGGENDIDDDGTTNACASNVLAAWPLIQVLGESGEGRSVLTEAFRLCHLLPENATDRLLEFAQSPWFDMAGTVKGIATGERVC